MMFKLAVTTMLLWSGQATGTGVEQPKSKLRGMQEIALPAGGMDSFRPDLDTAAIDVADAEERPSFHRKLSATLWLEHGRPATLDNRWSGWKGNDYKEYFVCGVQLKYNAIRGTNWGVNGMQIAFCHIDDWSKQSGFVLVAEKPVGKATDWNGYTEMCPEGKYVGGANYKAHDRWGMTGLKIICFDRNLINKSPITVLDTEWGSFVGENTYTGRLANAATTAINYALEHDRSSLNGLALRMVIPPTKAEVLEEKKLSYSKAAVTGYWEKVVSGPTQTSYTVTVQTTRTDGKEVTHDFALTIGASISVGFGDFFEASASVETSYGMSTSVTSSLEQSHAYEISVTCDPEPGKIAFVWQWVMHQDADSSGNVGFHTRAKDFLCTPTIEGPKCPVGFCKDLACQTCLGGEKKPNAQGIYNLSEKLTTTNTEPAAKVVKNPGANWNKHAVTARDVGSSIDGTVWVISNEEDTALPGNYLIYRLVGGDKGWVKVSGSARHISVADKDNIVVASTLGIWKWDETDGWIDMKQAETAADVSIGADGTVWMTGSVDNGAKIWRRKTDETYFSEVPGGGHNIAAGSADKAALCNGNDIYVYVGANGWKPKGNCKGDISVDKDGVTLWAIGPDGHPIHSPDYGETWDAPVTGLTGKRISGSNKYGFFLVTDDHELWQYYKA